MFDYYGLPPDWPDKPAAVSTPSIKAVAIERALHEDICAQMGKGFISDRFIPYVQMHEFEALLFSEPTVLAAALRCPSLADSLQAVISECQEPEAIDDHRETSPSKRILRHCPRYDKVLQGTTAASSIGLSRMRERCPHFNDWLTRLESLRVQ